MPSLSNPAQPVSTVYKNGGIVMLMLSRRTAILLPLAAAAIPTRAAGGKMSLCIHQNTSMAAGYRKSLEGWAKAGVKNVEITDRLLDDFLKTDPHPTAN